MPNNTLLKTKDDFQNGQLLLIDKPYEWSSFQAVNAIKWGIRRKFDLKKIKVGHAGTLDPLATGLLLICTGAFTKKINTLQGMPKEYTGTLHLGATTPSYDLETEVNHSFPTSHISEASIHEVCSSFIGEIQQVPPVFSALKKEGRRLYDYARKGENVHIEPRKVTIHEFEITAINFPKVSFRVVCSKGTYIRTLANDFGEKLRSGAYLSELRRTKIGDYNVNKAVTPVVFQEKVLGNS